MAGLYLHIPFCRKACHYCNFHFSTSLAYKERLLHALHKEIVIRNQFLKEKSLETIYFGGGTPSVLNVLEIENLLAKISAHFSIQKEAEITFEVNPDDVNPVYLEGLLNQGVNRLSVGIQSFHEEDLTYMNRSHSAEQAIQALKDINKAGFKDFSLDLIYGGHTTTNPMWKENIELALSFKPNHISAYCMTIESNTVFGAWNKTGKLTSIDDEKASEQFTILTEALKEKGYEHYEISNFALPGRYAVHNTNYWMGKPYLGIGPSAHSYKNNKRTWNISNNAKYMSSIENNELPFSEEVLTLADRYNEYIMTRLRTMWGIDLNYLKDSFGEDIYTTTLNKSMDKNIKNLITSKGDCIKLSEDGKMFADAVASHFFVINDE